jgi:thiol:disulfide interchange protein DsbC
MPSCPVFFSQRTVFMGRCLAVSAVLLFWTVSAALAMDGCGAGACASCHTLTIREANELLHGVGEVKKIDAAPVNGLWLLEMEKEGRRGVVFIDFGKKNLIAGTVFPLTPEKAGKQQPKEPTAVVAHKGKLDVAQIPLDNSIVMGNPRGTTKLFVFTDPDCSFCARLHGELKKLVALEPDLAIYVKMYPLKIHPRAYDRARTILAARSPELLDRAFAGGELPMPGAAESGMPVDVTIRVAESLGIDATPTLVLPDGSVIVGGRDAESLKGLLAAAGK